MERLGIVIMLMILPTLIITMGMTWGQEEIDEHEFETFLDPSRKELQNFPLAVMPVTHEGYKQNCSDCHLGYSPNLLPARSWEQLMTVEALEDHFEEYIYLDEDERQEILNYLVAFSAESSTLELPKKIMRSIDADETPIRIREVRAIYRRHDVLPSKYVVGNSEVISLSQCQACHQQADRGIFDENDVFIPFTPITPLVN